MRRRQLLGLVAGALAFRPLAGAAKVLPVVGFLHSGSPAANRERLAAYLQGLRDGGFEDGGNLTIEYRWADGDAAKLPELAGRLVEQDVTVVAAPGSTPGAVAASRATSTIPIVFAVGADPVAVGLVQSLAHPGGNATGITSQNGDLGAKHLQLLRQLAPATGHYFALINPTSQIASGFLEDLQHGAARFGVAVDVLRATNDAELEAAFAGLPEGRRNAVAVSPDSFFYIRRARLTALALQHATPTIYDDRAYVAAGGLVSYGADWLDVMRLAGLYTARVLQGAKPADLPVIQADKFDSAINLSTAKALGLSVPPLVLAQADEVIP